MKIPSSRIAIVAHLVLVITILAVTISTFSAHSPVLADQDDEQVVSEMLVFTKDFSGPDNLKCGNYVYEVLYGTFDWFGPFIGVSSIHEQERGRIEVPHENDASIYFVETQLVTCTSDELPVIRVMDHIYKNDITRSNETLYLFDPLGDEFTAITEPTFEEDGAGFRTIVTSQVRPDVLYGYDSRALPTENGHSSNEVVRKVVSFNGAEIEWSTPVNPDGHSRVSFAAESPKRLEMLFEASPPTGRRGHPLGSVFTRPADSTADKEKTPVPALPGDYVLVLNTETGEIIEKNEFMKPDTPPEDPRLAGENRLHRMEGPLEHRP